MSFFHLSYLPLFFVIALVGLTIILFRSGDQTQSFLLLFDSTHSRMQLQLYMSALAVISLVFYTGYAMMVRGFPFNMVDFGRSLGIVFAGVGFGSIGHGLQARDAASIPPTPEETPPTNTVTFFDRLCDANDSSAEMHLFLGALGIIGLIVFVGYHLAYIAHDFNPSDYGQAIAVAFIGVGAAAWGQGYQRKLAAAS